MKPIEPTNKLIYRNHAIRKARIATHLLFLALKQFGGDSPISYIKLLQRLDACDKTISNYTHPVFFPYGKGTPLQLQKRMRELIKYIRMHNSVGMQITLTFLHACHLKPDLMDEYSLYSEELLTQMKLCGLDENSSLFIIRDFKHCRTE